MPVKLSTPEEPPIDLMVTQAFVVSGEIVEPGARVTLDAATAASLIGRDRARRAAPAKQEG